MSIPYNPTSDDGAGFLVPLFKAAHHLHVAVIASGKEWPITNEEVRSEIDHAISHAGQIGDGVEVLSTTMREHVADWIAQVTALRDDAHKLEQKDAQAQFTAAATNKLRDQLKSIATQTWALLSLFDIELLGYAPERTDAGRKP